MRVTKKTNNEINRVIKNFNQKIDRLQKLDRDLELPDKINKKDLLNVTSRAELNRKLNSLRRYSRRGVEETVKLDSGVKLSAYEKKEIGISLRVAKAKLTKKINTMQTLKPKVAGKEQFSTFSQMGDSHYLNLLAQRKRLQENKIEKLNIDELTRLKSMTSKALKIDENFSFRENYKKMLKDISFLGQYDEEKFNTILKKIDKLNDKNFIKLFNEDKIIQEIVYRYDNIKDNSQLDYTLDNNMLFDEIYDNLDAILKDYQ